LISGLVSQWLVGSSLYLGYPPVGQVRFSLIPIAIAIGALGGALGGFFGASIFKLQLLIGQRLHLFKLKTGLVVALACGVIVVGLGLVDARAMGPGNHLISEIMAGNTPAGLETVLVRFATTLASYLSGCAGGIFAPSLALGASLGGWVASWSHSASAVLLALLGMIAVLTGVTRCPFTSFVLMVEMTDRHSAIFPMMLTALVADGSARLFGHDSFYEKSKRALLRELSPAPAPVAEAPRAKAPESQPSLVTGSLFGVDQQGE
jgi:H+/Cl- antiporter ClcA